MDRMGIVVELKSDTAVVKLQRHLSCEQCGRCGGIFGGPDQTDHLVEVLNPIRAEVGQRVLIAADDRQMMFASFMLLLLPLAVLIGGIFIWLYISVRLGLRGKPELPAVAVGAVLMGLVYAGLRRWDNRLKDNAKYKPVIKGLWAADVDKPEGIL